MRDYPPGAIWPASNFHDRQIREVYSRFGLAMFQAQVMQHGIVNALLVLRLMPTRKDYSCQSDWEAAFDRFYEVELDKTFGNMLKALLAAENLPPDLADRLRLAKEERDYLAHRFFREHDMDFMTKEGRTRMIAESERLIELFAKVDRALEAHVAPQRQRFGITPEWIEARVSQIERDARERDAAPNAKVTRSL